jgi:hypothetical protein
MNITRACADVTVRMTGSPGCPMEIAMDAKDSNIAYITPSKGINANPISAKYR